MSFVYDLRTTLVFALAGVVTLGSGLRVWAAGEPPDAWLSQVAIGVFLCLALADDVQRRWRGDLRTRREDPDVRSLAVVTAGFVALAVLGTWSFVNGHDPSTWAVLLGGGLLGAASCGWTLRGLRS